MTGADDTGRVTTDVTSVDDTDGLRTFNTVDDSAPVGQKKEKHKDRNFLFSKNK